MTTFASTTLALGPDFISADRLASAGLVVVLLVVFAESGLLIGFFLPGDSLLFTMGLLIAQDEVSTPLWLACLLIGIAAVVGDQVGYLFGRKVGPALFRRPDSRLFKQEYVVQANEFFEKYGPRSIVLARFVPIVRTFTPVIAGVSQMNYRQFVTFNIVGGILWGCGVTTLGFYLGKIDFIRENVEAMLILIVLVSVVPIIIEFLRARRKKAAAQAAAPAGEGAMDAYQAQTQAQHQPQAVAAYDGRTAGPAGYGPQAPGYDGMGYEGAGYGGAGYGGRAASGGPGYRGDGYGAGHPDGRGGGWHEASGEPGQRGPGFPPAGAGFPPAGSAPAGPPETPGGNAPQRRGGRRGGRHSARHRPG